MIDVERFGEFSHSKLLNSIAVTGIISTLTLSVKTFNELSREFDFSFTQNFYS